MKKWAPLIAFFLGPLIAFLIMLMGAGLAELLFTFSLYWWAFPVTTAVTLGVLCAVAVYQIQKDEDF